MKILAIISSARKDGAGAKITQAVCEEAAKQGAEIEYIHLYDLDFKSCGDCQMSDADPGYCTKQDDLVDVMKKLVAADAIVWSAPIYMDYICGTAKTFLDRFCIFVEPDFTINRVPGKKIALIITSGAPSPSYAPINDAICASLTDFFKMDVVGKLNAGGFMKYGQPIPADILAQAQEIGKKLT